MRDNNLLQQCNQTQLLGCRTTGCYFGLSGCYFGLSGCYFGLSGCYFVLSGCYFLLSGCYFGLSECYFGLSRCYFGLSGCYFGLSGCYFGLSGCYFGLSGCYFGLSGCYFGLSGCYFGLSGCYFGLSGCYFGLSGCYFGLFGLSLCYFGLSGCYFGLSGCCLGLSFNLRIISKCFYLQCYRIAKTHNINVQYLYKCILSIYFFIAICLRVNYWYFISLQFILTKKIRSLQWRWNNFQATTWKLFLLPLQFSIISFSLSFSKSIKLCPRQADHCNRAIGRILNWNTFLNIFRIWM